MNFYDKVFFTNSLISLSVIGILCTGLGILMGWILWRSLTPLKEEVEKENSQLKEFVLEQERKTEVADAEKPKESPKKVKIVTTAVAADKNKKDI